MAAMPITLERKPFAKDSEDDQEQTTIEFVADMDTLVESAACSCNAGDDNPY
ncbi:hypothetical protein K3N28_05930 [Glycomyces sp. TRM65418]|uniref:hypothetical protein n=1 Tax=Glycomyces sp. TRM65418 TaxID=2867006 RepID=UPI001CE697A9|nr:hypothetical protein [Glycomyces sp. TRM65418]MCC3762608.1 hypothetical protein [Glycomyces sp. TRM65418]QZD56646.1 hypothetical protein K3N28_05890 [Glycomyces sp. TRM65418]